MRILGPCEDDDEMVEDLRIIGVHQDNASGFGKFDPK